MRPSEQAAEIAGPHPPQRRFKAAGAGQSKPASFLRSVEHDKKARRSTARNRHVACPGQHRAASSIWISTEPHQGRLIARTSRPTIRCLSPNVGRRLPAGRPGADAKAACVPAERLASDSGWGDGWPLCGVGRTPGWEGVSRTPIGAAAGRLDEPRPEPCGG